MYFKVNYKEENNTYTVRFLKNMAGKKNSNNNLNNTYPLAKIIFILQKRNKT
jgi:hypothetical protein